MTISLSTVRPDHDDLVAGLQEVLTGASTWQDLLTSSTGQTLIEAIAAVGAYDQFSIQQGVLNAFPTTASAESSIYAITQMLGIRLTRKAPVEVTADISIPAGELLIAAYSQFSGAGSYWYTPEAVVVTSTPQSITLRQGLVKALSLPGTGTDYQAFVTQERGYLVADQDVLVYINGDQVPVLTTGLWEAKQTPGVQDITLPDGRLGLVFGTDVFGSKPGTSDVVNIFYAVTSGTDAASLVTNGEKITYSLDTTVDLVCTSSPTGGGDEKAATVYKSVSSPLFGTFGSGITKRQYVGTILEYPGVVDALTYAQRESNPKALVWMNLFRVVALTETLWSASQIATFLEWLNTRTMYSGRFFFESPVAYDLTLNINVFCSNVAALSQVQVNVRNALLAHFQEAAGVLGRDVYRSDIIDVALAADSSIDYVVLNAPSSDLLLSRRVVNTPTYQVLAGGGSLAIGSYDYAVSYISSFGAGGIIAPSEWVSVYNNAGSGRIKLDWTAVPNVSQYLVWGRTAAGTLGVIATLSSATLTWTDDGSVSPVPPLLAIDTQPIYYARLPTGSLTVTAAYSSRTLGNG